MPDDAEAMKARIAALEAENDRLKAQTGQSTRTWTVAEISAMDHETYLEHEREVLAALREGRVVRDLDPDVAQTTAQAVAIVERLTAAP